MSYFHSNFFFLTQPAFLCPSGREMSFLNQLDIQWMRISLIFNLTQIFNVMLMFI